MRIAHKLAATVHELRSWSTLDSLRVQRLQCATVKTCICVARVVGGIVLLRPSNKYLADRVSLTINWLFNWLYSSRVLTFTWIIWPMNDDGTNWILAAVLIKIVIPNIPLRSLLQVIVSFLRSTISFTFLHRWYIACIISYTTRVLMGCMWVWPQVLHEVRMRRMLNLATACLVALF